jgi:hypothetical protein
MTAAAAAPVDAPSDELICHAVASIHGADHFSLPFPHILFRDFFPEDFYRDLLNAVPAAGYDPITATGSRMALRLYGEHVDEIEPELRAVWTGVSTTLTSPEVEAAIRAKLHDGLQIRARGDKVGNVDELKMVAKPVLYKDSDGYQIKPHPDARKKVVTMQLYCPADDKQADLGTTLYWASIKGLLHPESYWLEPFKTPPFLPNAGYAFVVLKAYHSLARMSWHGRPPIKTPIDRPRISILNTFYVNEAVGF